MNGWCIGIDIGGTKIEAVVGRPTSDGFDIAWRKRIATERERGYEHIVAATAGLARQAASAVNARVEEVGIGVGMPGHVTRRDGVVKNSNTTCLIGRPFREDLSRALGAPVAFDNDANCFALAETRFGVGRPYRDGVVFGVILGTGVGGGVVFRGEVWSGLQGIAGEWGHHAVFHGAERPCYCGQSGCVEAYLSGPAVERDYAARSGERRSLAEIAARRVVDAHAHAAIETMLDAFGRGLANVIDILDPSAIVLGGGVSNLDLLYDEGRDRVARYVFNDELTTPILRHALGDSAGVIGAALLVESQGRSTDAHR